MCTNLPIYNTINNVTHMFLWNTNFDSSFLSDMLIFFNEFITLFPVKLISCCHRSSNSLSHKSNIPFSLSIHLLAQWFTMVNLAVTVNKLHTDEVRLEKRFTDINLMIANCVNHTYKCPQYSNIKWKMEGGGGGGSNTQWLPPNEELAEKLQRVSEVLMCLYCHLLWVIKVEARWVCGWQGNYCANKIRLKVTIENHDFSRNLLEFNQKFKSNQKLISNHELALYSTSWLYNAVFIPMV